MRALKAWRGGESDFADSLMGVSMRVMGCDCAMALNSKPARSITHQLLGWGS